MSEGLMAYNNISSGSDTGVVTKTKIQTSKANTVRIGNRGMDNHTAVLITFNSMPSGILACKNSSF